MILVGCWWRKFAAVFIYENEEKLRLLYLHHELVSRVVVIDVALFSAFVIIRTVFCNCFEERLSSFRNISFVVSLPQKHCSETKARFQNRSNTENVSGKRFFRLNNAFRF